LTLALVLLGGATASHAAGRLFFDDFESGNTNKWSTDGARSRCSIVQSGIDGGKVHGGKNMLQCNWNGLVAWNDTNAYSTMMLPQNQWNYNSEFFVRMWLRYDSDVDHTYGGKVFRFDPNDKLDSFYILPQMNDTGGPAQIDWELINGDAGPEFWGAGAPLGDQNWHKVEIYMKASASASGALKIWVDGNLVMQNSNMATVTAGHQWGPLFLMSNWSNNPGWEHDAANHVYWDDIEIFTDTGSGATGNMSDATISAGTGSTPPPAAAVPDPPTGLTVQ
jgi:hypothetical protein